MSEKYCIKCIYFTCAEYSVKIQLKTFFLFFLWFSKNPRKIPLKFSKSTACFAYCIYKFCLFEYQKNVNILTLNKCLNRPNAQKNLWLAFSLNFTPPAHLKICRKNRYTIALEKFRRITYLNFPHENIIVQRGVMVWWCDGVMVSRCRGVEVHWLKYARAGAFGGSST